VWIQIKDILKYCSTVRPHDYKGFIMALDATVRARIDTQLKEDVEEIFKQIGLTTSQAITIFMKRVKHEQGIPFELKIPSAKTLQALEEADNRIGETISYEEFMKESEAHAKTLQN